MSTISQIFKRHQTGSESAEVKPRKSFSGLPALDEKALYHRMECETTMLILTDWCERIEAGVKSKLPAPLTNYALSALSHSTKAKDLNLTAEVGELLERCVKASKAYFEL